MLDVIYGHVSFLIPTAGSKYPAQGFTLIINSQLIAQA